MAFGLTPITIQSLFGQKRMIGSLTVQVVISEETNDTLSITKQPVQQGASITDHAYSEPTVLTMSILQQNSNIISGLLSTFSGGGLQQIYQEFLNLQSNRQPFTVITPKRVYNNMLISVLRLNTDKRTENILSLAVSMQQVIIVTVGTATIPPGQQGQPRKTQPTQNTGQKSALLTTAQAFFPGTVGAHAP